MTSPNLIRMRNERAELESRLAELQGAAVERSLQASEQRKLDGIEADYADLVGDIARLERAEQLETVDRSQIIA